MKGQFRWLALAVAVCLLPALVQEAVADDGAMEQLVTIFEKKGMVTPEEARTIRESIGKEREQLKGREQAVQERERSVQQREQALSAREESLGVKPGRTVEAGKPAAPGETEAKPATAAKESEPPTEQGKGSVPMVVAFDDGLWLRTVDPDIFSLRVGALLQADYRFYDYDSDDPNKDRFDIRRARLYLMGKALKYFGYKFEYEFQGGGGRRLLDAYADAFVFPYAAFRIGQFKVPFGLEQSSEDEEGYFAERSMGYWMDPQRDVGLMLYGGLWDQRVYYGFGLFNGDGLDDATGGDVDTLPFYGRTALTPFARMGLPLLDNFQVGGSYGHGRVDRNNVDIHIYTAGLTEFFDVESSAKFKIIQSSRDQTRYGFDLAWGIGPFALLGEYVKWQFRDIRTSSDQFDTEMEDYYVGLLWMITGENPSFRDGRIQAIKPRRPVGQGGWGAFGIAFRYDVFDADKSVYDTLIIEGTSVRQAKAYTITLNWYLNPVARFIVDATRTRFDEPLLIDRDSVTGAAVYAKREDVITGRFQLGF